MTSDKLLLDIIGKRLVSLIICKYWTCWKSAQNQNSYAYLYPVIHNNILVLNRIIYTFLCYHFYLHWGLISFIFQGQHSQVKIINLQIEIKVVDELLHRTIKCIQDRIFTRDFLCNDRHLKHVHRIMSLCTCNYFRISVW
jgi:hypothetical protein